jgi:ribosome-binding factor A
MTFKRSRSKDRGGGRKALQLSRQVQKALLYALSETNDDRLHELYVEAVVPAPNDKRLLVTVSPMADDFDPADALLRLQHATPFLRQQVAMAITRKRVPELIFQFRPREAADSV